MADNITAVTAFHPVEDAADFGVWTQSLLASAQSAAGHVSGRVAVHDDPRLDLAVAVTFSSEPELHSWLDGSERAEILHDGQRRGFWCSSGDLVLTGNGPSSAGIGLFRHAVTAGKEDEFRQTQMRLTTAAVRLPGYEGSVLVPGDQPGEWLSLVRFRTGQQLSNWMRSAERAEALQGLRSTLSRDYSVASNTTTPFATTVRIEDGRTLMTPNWKSAMLVLLVLYPTVMLLSRFLGPIVNDFGAPPWLGLWMSQIASISALQYLLMPMASRPFHRWLDPVDGRGARIGIAGAAIIVVLYVLTLTLFASVHELQFWDYSG